MIPVYKAKKTNSDEWFEGFLMSNNQIRYTESYPMGLRDVVKTIDPSTLIISFDNGKTFVGLGYITSLQHYYDTTVGMFATDRPDLVDDSVHRVLFELEEIQ